MKLLKLILLSHILFVMPLLAADSAKCHIRLVFMGKTGVGKSTTVNAFYNFAEDISWNAQKLFPIKTEFQPCNVHDYTEINAEDHAHGQLYAVTQNPSEYVAKGADMIVSLIDCPGVADPRGIKKDNEISSDIVNFLHLVGEFNAICIVLNGSISRATPEEMYAIEQIKTMIPKSALDRIFIVLTNTTRVNKNARDFIESVSLPVDNMFAFDHFAFSKEGYANLDKDEELAKEVELKWRISKKAFDRLITTAKSLGKYFTAEMGAIYEIKTSMLDKISIALRRIRRNANNNEPYNKKKIQHQLLKLYIQLDGVSISSINFSIGEYYDMSIRNESNVIKKANLEREMQFYTEQVELYKLRAGQL